MATLGILRFVRRHVAMSLRCYGNTTYTEVRKVTGCYVAMATMRALKLLRRHVAMATVGILRFVKRHVAMSLRCYGNPTYTEVRKEVL